MVVALTTGGLLLSFKRDESNQEQMPPPRKRRRREPARKIDEVTSFTEEEVQAWANDFEALLKKRRQRKKKTGPIPDELATPLMMAPGSMLSKLQKAAQKINGRIDESTEAEPVHPPTPTRRPLQPVQDALGSPAAGVGTPIGRSSSEERIEQVRRATTSSSRLVSTVSFPDVRIICLY
ncbi:unnamed protein product [Gongylonema pulchrum]|uniref:Transmembrane protein n=1 Tax=Gongylonema pulchrum TaxID=637853 RepID=A0A183E8K7_9BILA|nr:unnamed protein product [Gongylonema pulchrum]